MQVDRKKSEKRCFRGSNELVFGEFVEAVVLASAQFAESLPILQSAS